MDLLNRYFRGRHVDFGSLDLDLSGASSFQRRVYRVLKSMPRGEVRTYGWIASRIGKPNASRAVGRALGANPLPILLPCHRVVASLAFSRGHPGRIETWQVRASLLTPANGLGGFSCGLDIKRRLLELEGG
ncbi:MAG: MGMT family protein [Nitrospirae bacterium]|nr:MGMT family protein [Nitrospirota bacterium]